MKIEVILLVVAITFGICFVLDKGFTRVFRNKAQHKTGLSVRANKRYASFGLVICVLGVSAIFTGLSNGWILIVCGGILVALGIGMIVYYMTFGIFYDADQFILTTFGNASKTYFFKDIVAQQLFYNYGHILIELYMSDGRSVQLQSSMVGVYTFMDKAFEGWLRQTGKKREDCDFYDPQNSCWFPTCED